MHKINHRKHKLKCDNHDRINGRVDEMEESDVEEKYRIKEL